MNPAAERRLWSAIPECGAPTGRTPRDEAPDLLTVLIEESQDAQPWVEPASPFDADDRRRGIAIGIRLLETQIQQAKAVGDEAERHRLVALMSRRQAEVQRLRRWIAKHSPVHRLLAESYHLLERIVAERVSQHCDEAADLCDRIEDDLPNRILEKELGSTEQ